MDQPAETIPPPDLERLRRSHEAESRPLRVGRSEAEGAVRPMTVVVLGEDAQDVLELPPADDQDPVETLAPGLSARSPSGRGNIILLTWLWRWWPSASASVSIPAPVERALHRRRHPKSGR